MDISGSARCLGVWSLATASALALVLWAAPELGAVRGYVDDPGSARFDHWIVALCAGLTAVCTAWGWVVTTIVVLGAMRGHRTAGPSPGVPAWARRLVLAACGLAAVGAAMSPAAASSGDDGGGSVVDLLQGLPLPDRAEGTEARTTKLTHRVSPGDSLWAISEAELAAAGREADAAAVTERWHRLYEHNRGVVGDDPDLIHPGQQLRLPPLGKEE